MHHVLQDFAQQGRLVLGELRPRRSLGYLHLEKIGVRSTWSKKRAMKVTKIGLAKIMKELTLIRALS